MTWQPLVRRAANVAEVEVLTRVKVAEALKQHGKVMQPAYLDGATWGAPGAPVEHIETHAAHVFLVGEFAYKLKKPVVLPYLDFGTLEKRRAIIAREYEINKALTSDIYLGVIEVLGEPVLKMKRFATDDILHARVAHGGCPDELARKLAAMAAAAHQSAPPISISGAEIMRGLGAQLTQAFVDSPAIFPRAETRTFHEQYEACLARLSPLLDARAEQGLVRRCHGDMHYNNIAIVNGEPLLFDAIEFSEKIGTIDVLYDLAFLIMDLQWHGQPRAANIVMNRYFELRRSEEDLTGLALLPLFLATRAGVRALVAADRARTLEEGDASPTRAEARDYFTATLSYLQPIAPRLVCIGGFSGSGKTTAGRSLAPNIGQKPGALHLRSDVERKFLAGVPETQALSPAFYTPDRTQAVYQRLHTFAETALRAGHSVVIDAVFAREAEREAVAILAQSLGVPFTGIWLQGNREVLRQRVAVRTGDASDATPQIVDQQFTHDIGKLSWAVVNASGGQEDTLIAANEILRRPSAAQP